MPDLNKSSYELIVNNFNDFITSLKNSAYNISTTHYVSAHNLLRVLAAQDLLPTKTEQLSLLLMPLLCCCEKEQQDFPRRFSVWIESLAVDNLETERSIDVRHLKGVRHLNGVKGVRHLVAKVSDIFQMSDTNATLIKKNKNLKKQFVVLVLVLLLGLLSYVFQDVIQQRIQNELDKYFPITVLPPVPLVQPPRIQNPLAIIPNTVETEIKKTVLITPDDKSKRYIEIAFSFLAIILTAFFVLWGWLYLQTHRFLKNHSVLSPPELKSFFLNKPRPLFELLDFTFTAQQLHKHRHVASDYLDPQATIKQTLSKAGIFTPCYQILRAVPEYLILIDRSSFKDQLAASVDDLIKQLKKIGLFIDCFYFDEDPRRCYRQDDNKLQTRVQTLDSLLASYPSHRLLIFSDSSHFVDPITGQLNLWANEFAHSQQPVLFTFAEWQAFGFKEALLHEAGFVVLPWNDDGFEKLVQHFDHERETVDFLGDEEGTADLAVFPVLVRQRLRRLLERHKPNDELVSRLLKSLKSYLGERGFCWLAACAVYPQLEGQLTLHLGYALFDKDDFEQSLFIRLLRLPWFRHGFMPNWLRWQLLSQLSVEQDTTIRLVIYQLLADASEDEDDKHHVKLEVAKEGKILHSAKRMLKFWTRRVANNHELKDFVFQSFLQGKLAVKAPDNFIASHKKRYVMGSLGLCVTVLLFVLIKTYFEPVPLVEQTVIEKVSVNFNMVSLKGGCFMMGSPKTEVSRSSNEKQHQVCVEDFQIGETEVTQALWQAVMGDNPSRFKGDLLPVEEVSWNEVQGFIKKLNALTGKTYRLPTEAEWEYAARAGTTTPFYTGDCISTEQANYDGNYSYNNCEKGVYKETTVAVGSYPANPWGLQDMAGNVWEWTCSEYDKEYNGKENQCLSNNDAKLMAVLRGGSWFYKPRDSRSAYRNRINDRNFYVGFRVSRM